MKGTKMKYITMDFDCPPPYFDASYQPGWTLLAKAILRYFRLFKESQSVINVLKYSNNKGIK